MKVLATYARLMDVVDTHTGVQFYWENDDTRRMEPLWIDPTTANLMFRVHQALSEANQDKFREWVAQSRAHFVTMVEFSWSKVIRK